jgi:hypothetical protein
MGLGREQVAAGELLRLVRPHWHIENKSHFNNVTGAQIERLVRLRCLAGDGFAKATSSPLARLTGGGNAIQHIG